MVCTEIEYPPEWVCRQSTTGVSLQIVYHRSEFADKVHWSGSADFAPPKWVC